MEINETTVHAGLELIKILGLEPKCTYCSVSITKENFGGVFSKPKRVSCDSLLCLSEAITDSEEETVEGIIKGKKRWN